MFILKMVDQDQDDYSSISEQCISGDSDKENSVGNTAEGSSLKRKRLPRSTTLQLQKIQSYMQSHDDFSKGKTNEIQEHDWNQFTIELNSCGPPFHTGKEWRKVWSDRKGNEKRKRPAVEKITQLNREPGRNNIRSETNEMRSDVQVITDDFRDEILPANIQSIEFPEEGNIQIEILRSLDFSVEQQNETNSETNEMRSNVHVITDEFRDEILPANTHSIEFPEERNIQIQILNTLNFVVEQQKETNSELKKLNKNFSEFMDFFKRE